MTGSGDEPRSETAEEAPPEGSVPATPQAGEAAGPPEAAEAVGLEACPEPPPTRDEFEELRRERDELQDQLLRRRAELLNYRKRVERDREHAWHDAVAQVLTGLIPTLDNLERALASSGTESALREGVELIRRDLVAFLGSHGVTVDDPIGQVFDPSRHQALSYEPVDGAEDGHIVEVFSKGYALKDRLLRPALVKVAKGEGAAEPGEILH
jgi:molecular chaperone GrpE